MLELFVCSNSFVNNGRFSIASTIDAMGAEDACQVRKGRAPHVLAVLNSCVLALLIPVA